jgi:hypothetical protein
VIFSRRRVQDALWSLPFLPAPELRGLAARLNRSGPDALSAMWEVMLLHHLSAIGHVKHHRATPNGSRPDIFFQSKVLTFTADISCVSDDGIQKDNPFRSFQDEIEGQKRALGMGIGGVYLNVGHHEGEQKVKLKLPAVERIPDFVREEVIPAIAAAQARGEWPIVVRWETPDIEFQLTLQDGPYSGGSSRAYDVPKTLKSNPVYGRLKEKTSQVAMGEGLRGLILCDSGYSAFTKSPLGGNRVDARAITQAFLNGCADVDFVALFWVFEDRNWMRATKRELRCDLIQKSFDPALQAVFDECVERLPKPLRTGQNAMNHLRRWGMDFGFSGGWTLSWPTVRLSAKTLLHLLAGRISIVEFNDRFDWRGADEEDQRKILNCFERALQEGLIPGAIRVLSEPDQDDDWIEIDFKRDAALGKFRDRKSWITPP